MRSLWTVLRLCYRHRWPLLAGIILTIFTLFASTGLLTLSGWFLASCALAGPAGALTFNYVLPAAGVRAAAILRTAGRYAERLVSHDATFRLLQDLRVLLFQRLFPLAAQDHALFRRGDLLNRLVADVDTLDQSYLRLVSPLIGALAVIAICGGGFWLLNAELAWLLVGVMLLTLLALPAVFGLAGRAPGRQVIHSRQQYRSQLTEWLSGMAEFTLFNASETQRQALAETETRWQQAQQRQATLFGLSQALMAVIGGLTALALLWLAAGLREAQQLSAAMPALVVFCALAAFEALAPVSGAFLYLGQISAAWRRVRPLLEQTPSITFPARGPARAPQASLTLDAVSFAYPGALQPVLQSATLRLAAGEHLALLGPTGCGKSTLLQLLTRSYLPQQGQILLNDAPLETWDEPTLRAMISVVPQRIDLFSATLRDNLLLARPDADDAALIAVLRQTGLAALLTENGLDGWVGEGGRQLSGGERRRLGLARALLHDAPLWLLDEPTEGLDAQTEQQILDLLQQVTRDRTVIMVTHRLRGLARFRCCRLEAGQLMDIASPASTAEEALPGAGATE